MKKVIVLSFILLIAIATITNVYAASSFEMKLKASKNELDKNEEFVVEAIVSKIEFDKGIIALGGKLEYDTDSLELVKIEGGDHWAKPSYNENTGKFVTDREDCGTTDETVFKMTFKVKEQSKENVNIKLLEVSASNGKDEKKLENIATSVTVKNGTSTPDEPKPDTNTAIDNNNTNTSTSTDSNTNTNTNTNNNNTQNTNSNKDNSTNKNTNNSSNTNTNKNTNSNTNKNNNSSKNTNLVNNADNLKDGMLPKAGTTSIVLGILGIMIIVAGIFYARIRIIDNKSKH